MVPGMDHHDGVSRRRVLRGAALLGAGTAFGSTANGAAAGSHCEEKEPALDSPVHGIPVHGDRADLSVGPRGSVDWSFHGVDALHEELFVLADGDGNALPSTEMEVFEHFSPLRGGRGGSVGVTGYAFSTTARGELAGAPVFVRRRVQADPDEAVIDVEYAVQVPYADTHVSDLQLTQYADFDLGGCGAADASLDEDSGAAVVTASDDAPAVGLRGVSPAPDARAVVPASARDPLLAGSRSLQGGQQAADPNDPAVALTWSLGELGDVDGYHVNDEAAVRVRFAADSSAEALAETLEE